tara:strand:- start:5279 stop:5401 length:123 start_codon:yes stop_codon:yes gene_type:complete
LAAELCLTIADLEQKMSVNEFHAWMIYYKLKKEAEKDQAK